MAKKLNFPEQINVLCPDGTRNLLVAIAFYRGQKGKYADAARDLLGEGIARFQAELSAKEKAVFADILNSVKTSATYRKEIRSHGSG